MELKLERLSAGTHPIEGSGLNSSSLGEHNEPVITSLAERSEGLVITKQPNAVATMLPQMDSRMQAGAATTDIHSMLLNDPRVVPSFQPTQEQQVTSTSTSLSGAFLTSRPVSSEAVTTEAFTATVAPWSHNQSQCCHGKAIHW